MPDPSARRVLYASPFIPPELIAAHGFRPVRVAATSGTACHEGRCGIAEGFVDAPARGGDLRILVTSCDQQRRSGDDATGPLFRCNLTATWQTATALRIYRDELARLSRFLVRQGGTAPTAEHLATTVLDHDACRGRLRTACALLPARAAAQVLADHAGHGVMPAAEAVPLARDRRVPIALLGGPVPPDAFAVYDLIEDAGARVVLDGTEHGERGLAAAMDRRRVRDDPWGELVNAYFLGIPDAFRRPDALLYAWLERGIAERGIRAVVVRHDPWCDLWRAQVPRLKDWGRLPVLAVEAGGDAGSAPRLRTRIEALVEMIVRGPA